MNEHDATEVAYNNGYKQGTADAVRKMAEMMKSKVHGTNTEAIEAVIAFIDASAESCISCGKIIPESRQVCPQCEKLH